MLSQFASFSKSVITVYAPWGESFFSWHTDIFKITMFVGRITALGMVGRSEEKRKFQGRKSE